jgi:hypothetical protein
MDKPRARLDRFQIACFLLLRREQIQAQLQVQPEIGARPEKLRQAQRRAGSQTAAAIHDFIDALLRHMYRSG